MRAERMKFLDSLVDLLREVDVGMERIFFENAGRVEGFDKIVFPIDKIQTYIRMNAFIRKALDILLNDVKRPVFKAKVVEYYIALLDKITARLASVMVEKKSKINEEIVGPDAILYIGLMQRILAHKDAVWNLYVEGSDNPENAYYESSEMFWNIHAFVMTGRPPEKQWEKREEDWLKRKSRFISRR